jgi:cystathionine beta-lyase
MELENEPGHNTILQHFGEEEKLKGAVAPPIFQNSLFVFDTVDELFDAMIKHPAGPDHHYSRISNPTIEIAEKKIAKLEGTDGCKITGCGMAALSIAIMSCVEQGSHVVAIDTGYGPVKTLLTDYLSKFGVTHTFVNGCEVAELEAAIRPETTAIYLESPSSLVFQMQDMEAIAKIARGRGIATICDNTYNTPLHMQPHKIGIDVVCHSATKYLGGHSDIMAGAVCANQERIDKMIRQEIALLGSILHPFQSWLLNRSLRTLEFRLKRHEETANFIAAWLERQPEVERVNHISLPSFRQRDLYLKMMSGSGGLFSFEPANQDPNKIKAFVDSLKLFQRGVSWGGFESLALCMPVSPIGYPEKRWIVRLFCGLEDAEDIQADLQQALHLLR